MDFSYLLYQKLVCSLLLFEIKYFIDFVFNAQKFNMMQKETKENIMKVK